MNFRMECGIIGVASDNAFFGLSVNLYRDTLIIDAEDDETSNPNSLDRSGIIVVISEDTFAITASDESDKAIGVGLNEDGSQGTHTGAVV